MLVGCSAQEDPGRTPTPYSTEQVRSLNPETGGLVHVLRGGWVICACLSEGPTARLLQSLRKRKTSLIYLILVSC